MITFYLLPIHKKGTRACWRIVFVLIPMVLATMMIQPLAAQENSAVFRNFYIYKIALYLKYPGDQQGDFVITIVGDDPTLVEELRKTAVAKKVGERSIRVQVSEDAAMLGKSNLVVVPQKQSAKLLQVMRTLQGKPIVVLSENAQCQNTCINLTLQGSANGKKRFEINRSTTEAGGVRISSDLLAIAALCQ